MVGLCPIVVIDSTSSFVIVYNVVDPSKTSMRGVMPQTEPKADCMVKCRAEVQSRHGRQSLVFVFFPWTAAIATYEFKHGEWNTFGASLINVVYAASESCPEFEVHKCVACIAYIWQNSCRMTCLQKAVHP